jgi:hypothetical protein
MMPISFGMYRYMSQISNTNNVTKIMTTSVSNETDKLKKPKRIEDKKSGFLQKIILICTKPEQKDKLDNYKIMNQRED